MRGDRPQELVETHFHSKFTPHARGSTPSALPPPSKHGVYPACAGIDPPTTGKDMLVIGLPRMRGDRPSTHGLPPLFPTFTPHARGSTLNPIPCFLETTVYPACAGIDPRAKSRGIFERSLPRMRGDRPRIVYWYDEKTGFTPHARGSTPGCIGHTRKHTVYPACAGIDLLLIATLVDGGCLPRMRGDRPSSGRRFQATTGFTPHARGSTCRWMYASINSWVYPACAGIDLLWSVSIWTESCLPRMRGDRPQAFRLGADFQAFTPHARGSTSSSTPINLFRLVYPACAGIDPSRGTHVPYW